MAFFFLATHAFMHLADLIFSCASVSLGTSSRTLIDASRIGPNPMRAARRRLLPTFLLLRMLDTTLVPAFTFAVLVRQLQAPAALE
jgi:hypothetical protein